MSLQCLRSARLGATGALRSIRPSQRAIIAGTISPASIRPASNFASEQAIDQDTADEVQDSPRWSQTPAGMKAPFSLNTPKVPSRAIWRVNSDPAKLDQMYVRFLGRDGAKMLPAEIKWLAVTHKSFDQGRRGFNDRLAFFGRQAFVLEVARSIVFSPVKEGSVVPDPHGRTPFQHPSLASLDNFNATLPHDMVSLDTLPRFAVDIGLDKVLRWKPRMPEDLQQSGSDVVLSGAVLAIIGAISLQHGAAVAATVIRERLLPRLDSLHASVAQ